LRLHHAALDRSHGDGRINADERAYVSEFAYGTTCFLYPTLNAGSSKTSQAFWQVEGIEQEVAELEARGVKFEKYDMPGMGERRYLDGRRR